MINSLKKSLLSKYTILGLLILLFILIYRIFDTFLINDLILNSELNYNKINIITIITLFSLRFISIVFPMLPGTYCSVLAGYCFGFERGLFLIFLADLLSCTTSFAISRRLGRSFVSKFLGRKQMERVENISQKYLENNFFLMTGSLMTQFFDFVCYAIGLTKVSLKRFMPALIISILISDAPFVAAGFAFKDIKEVSVNQILNGEVNLIYGNYLVIFIFSILSIIGLGILNIIINKRSNFKNKSN